MNREHTTRTAHWHGSRMATGVAGVAVLVMLGSIHASAASGTQIVTGSTSGGVLSIAAPGNLLQASRLIIPYGQYCGANAACQDGQLLTPDGSKMLVTRVVTEGQDYADSVVEYSASTGQRLADLMPTIHTPYGGPPCVPLWTDPSGEQVISFCGGHGERYDDGHLSRVTLHPPMYGMNFGAAFAW